MTLQERLANLKKINQLTDHRPTLQEVQQHLENAKDHIKDAKNTSVSLLGRFNAAYNASHALLTAALKMNGYRTGDSKGHRQILFEMLDQLVPGAASAKSVLSHAHILRNKSEYDADPINATAALVTSMTAAVGNLDQEVRLAFKTFTKVQAVTASIKAAPHARAQRRTSPRP